MRRPAGVRRSGDDSGFTLIELLVVTLVMGIVLSIASAALYSLTTAGNRNTTMLGEEQTTSVAITQLTRDIRSASSISFPTGASPSDQLELSVLSPDTSATTTILWVFDPVGKTLTREEPSSAGSWQEDGFQVSSVANATSEPLFTYYDNAGTEIPGDTGGSECTASGSSTVSLTPPVPASYGTSVAAEATAVSVNLYVSSTTSSVAPYHQCDEVALTNLVNVNNPEGQGV